MCPCWQPLFLYLRGERKHSTQAEKSRSHSRWERDSAPVALIYSVRNGGASEIESPKMTHWTPRIAKETDQTNREPFRELGRVKLCSNLYVLYCIHHTESKHGVWFKGKLIIWIKDQELVKSKEGSSLTSLRVFIKETCMVGFTRVNSWGCEIPGPQST